MTRKAQEAGTSGLYCPTGGADHGFLLQLGPNTYHCPHSGHAPRPKTHPEGGASGTRSTFTLVEAENGKVAA